MPFAQSANTPTLSGADEYLVGVPVYHEQPTVGSASKLVRIGDQVRTPGVHTTAGTIQFNNRHSIGASTSGS